MRKSAPEMIEALSIYTSNNVETLFNEIIKCNKSKSIGFLNQHAYNLTSGNIDIKNDFLALDYLLRDGKGIELACKIFDKEPGENLNGTDLIPKLIKAIENSKKNPKFFVFGTKNPWLELGTKTLFTSNEVLQLDGFQSEQCYLDAYIDNETTTDLNVVLLAMGMPKQEKLAKQIKIVATSQVIVVCGGAIVDFSAGRFKRAPAVFQNFGLEWLYRLAKEPKRLFYRYVIGIPIFFMRIYKSKYF